MNSVDVVVLLKGLGYTQVEKNSEFGIYRCVSCHIGVLWSLEFSEDNAPFANAWIYSLGAGAWAMVYHSDEHVAHLGISGGEIERVASQLPDTSQGLIGTQPAPWLEDSPTKPPESEKPKSPIKLLREKIEELGGVFEQKHPNGGKIYRLPNKVKLLTKKSGKGLQHDPSFDVSMAPHKDTDTFGCDAVSWLTYRAMGFSLQPLWLDVVKALFHRDALPSPLQVEARLAKECRGRTYQAVASETVQNPVLGKSTKVELSMLRSILAVDVRLPTGPYVIEQDLFFALSRGRSKYVFDSEEDARQAYRIVRNAFINGQDELRLLREAGLKP